MGLHHRDDAAIARRARGAQDGGDLYRMMGIVIYEDQFIGTKDILEPPFHAPVGLHPSLRLPRGYPQLEGYRYSGYRIFHVMKTGDTKRDLLNVVLLVTIVEYKKSIFNGNIAGKKLPPVYAIGFSWSYVIVPGQLGSDTFSYKERPGFLYLSYEGFE